MRHQVYHAATHSNTYHGTQDFKTDGTPLVQTDLVHQPAAPFPDLETKAEWATHVTVTDYLGSTASSVLHHLTRRITSRSGTDINLYEIAAGAGAKERATRDALATLIRMGHILTRRQQNKPTTHFLPVDRILNTSSWYPRADLGFTRDNLKKRGSPHTPPQMAESAPHYGEKNRRAQSALLVPTKNPETADSAPPDLTKKAGLADSAPSHGEIRRDINSSQPLLKREESNQQTPDLFNLSSTPSSEYPHRADSAPKNTHHPGADAALSATHVPEIFSLSNPEHADSAPHQLQPKGAQSAPITPDAVRHFSRGADSAPQAPPDQFDEDYVRQTLNLYRELGIQTWTNDQAALKTYRRDYPKFIHDLQGWRKRQQRPSQHTPPQTAHHRDKYLKDYLEASQRATTPAVPC